MKQVFPLHVFGNFSFRTSLVFLFLIAGNVLSAQVRMPPEITTWIDKEGDSTVYGLGISALKNESDAFQQARSLGLENLAASLEVEVAAISENIVSQASTGDKTARVERFSAGTKQIVRQSISSAKLYGPYTNNRGSTYIIIYLDKRVFQKDINTLIHDIFADNDDDLDRMLGIK